MRLIDAESFKAQLIYLANHMQDNGHTTYAAAVGEVISILDRRQTINVAPKWISVEERLPENDDLVLVRANGRARETRWDGAYVLAMYGSEGWVLWDYEDDEVQHLKILQWMPLPEPPKEEANA